MNIKEIIDAIRADRVQISVHAREEAKADRLALDEVFESVFRGEVLEHYDSAKPYPSGLIYGQTLKEDHVHSVWAYNANNKWTVLVTVYRPEPNLWINWRERKKKS